WAMSGKGRSPGIVATHPYDLFMRIGHIGGDGHVVLEWFQRVIIPLAVAMLGSDFQDAASLKHAHQQIRPGVGVAVDVDCKLPACPISRRRWSGGKPCATHEWQEGRVRLGQADEPKIRTPDSLELVEHA